MRPETHQKTAYAILRSLRSWLSWFDAAHLRKHYCGWCMSPTVLQHDHSRAIEAEHRRLVAKEWRQ